MSEIQQVAGRMHLNTTQTTPLSREARGLAVMDRNGQKSLDGLAIRNANRGDSRESIRRKKNIFHNMRAIRTNRLKPAIRKFSAPRNAIRKIWVQFGKPETIRENQAIRICKLIRANRAI